jgi:hypothetical protein
MPAMSIAEQTEVWGPYASYDDVARFTYGQLLWRQPAIRERLLAHWLDERHPHRERFLAHREIVEEILSTDESPTALDHRLRERGASLRSVAREIPPVFGSFF